MTERIRMAQQKASDDRTSAKELTELYEEFKGAVASDVAFNRNATAELLSRVYEDNRGDMYVIPRLAGHKNMPVELVLEMLASDRQSSYLLGNVAVNANVSIEVLEDIFATHGHDKLVARGFAANSNTPVKILVYIQEQFGDDRSVLGVWLATHPRQRRNCARSLSHFPGMGNL